MPLPKVAPLHMVVMLTGQFPMAVPLATRLKCTCEGVTLMLRVPVSPRGAGPFKTTLTVCPSNARGRTKTNPTKIFA